MFAHPIIFEFQDENNVIDESLRNDVLKLFGRITAQQTTDAQVCRSYALLYQLDDATVEQDEKYVQLMQKAIRIDTQIKVMCYYCFTGYYIIIVFRIGKRMTKSVDVFSLTLNNGHQRN